MSNDMLKIGQFAKLAGVSVSTLRTWDTNGKLKPAFVSDGGTRFYTKKQLNMLKGAESQRIIAVITCQDKANLPSLTEEVEKFKKTCSIDVDLVIMNSSELEVTVYSLSDLLDTLYERKATMIKVFSENDNFIARIIRQTCLKNNIKYCAPDVKAYDEEVL